GAASGAEPAHHRRGGVGLQPGRDLSQPEASRRAHELGRQRSTLAAQRPPGAGEAHWGGLAVVKKADRSSSSAHTTATRTTVSTTRCAAVAAANSGTTTPPTKATSAPRRVVPPSSSLAIVSPA